jgi:hypothetical protein
LKGINNYILVTTNVIVEVEALNGVLSEEGYLFGIQCACYIHPQDVSFHAITVGEDGGKDQNGNDKVPAIKTGSQKRRRNHGHEKWSNGTILMHSVKPGNLVVVNGVEYDKAAFSEPYKVFNKPMPAGTYTWNIPWFFNYERRNEVVIETVTQKAVLDGSIMTMKKKDQEGKYRYIDPKGIIPNED